jgi:hypothetical protein
VFNLKLKKMKKDKLLEEFKEMKIENPRSVVGGQMGHETATGTEDCETCDSSTHKSPAPGDDDCDNDSDPDPDTGNDTIQPRPIIVLR